MIELFFHQLIQTAVRSGKFFFGTDLSADSHIEFSSICPAQPAAQVFGIFHRIPLLPAYKQQKLVRVKSQAERLVSEYACELSLEFAVVFFKDG